MRVVLSGGGTGGHIYPALSIAETLLKRDKSADILYIGTESGLESTLVPKLGYPFKTIRVKGFSRRLSIDTLKSFIELLKGMGDANRILNEYRPDIVVGTGGYVAGPVLMVAHLKGIPTVIHEQNVLPGVTNRILGRFAGSIAVSFDEAVKYFKNRDRVIVTGNPIRPEILTQFKSEAIKELGFGEKIPIVLSFGGSKGSDKLNSAMLGVITNLRREGVFGILHATGQDKYQDFMAALGSERPEPGKNGHIRIVPYLDNMPQALAAAELVITSAGAITIAEITAMGLPAILIPKSHAVDNHQQYNARALEEKGAAVVLLEKDLDGNRLNSEVRTLIKDKARLRAMGKASKKMGKIDAAHKICDIIVETVKQ